MKQSLLKVFVAVTVGMVPITLGGSSIYANEVDQQPSEPISTAILEANSLIERVYDAKEGASIHSYTEGENSINEVVESDGTVVATEIFKNNERISVTRTEDAVIVETSTMTENNEVETIQKMYPVIQDNPQNLQNDSSLRVVHGAWIYTNFAVGKNVFSTLVNIGIGALVSFTAGVFGITTIAAKFLLGYMGSYGLSVGSQIAKALDSNNNGWIGLHKREVRNYAGGPLIGYEHRTY